ncbi:hypothetical protein G4Z05_10200 [Bacillus thermocopriae]|uniref:Uncharacterized protein n=1 Tax=Neobacillus thermocopriae TaxID=1215031 RepID=A0A6B3TQH2_9BACI|nr:hypothetical protein [Neobacillus thermocopriae]
MAKWVWLSSTKFKTKYSQQKVIELGPWERHGEHVVDGIPIVINMGEI